MNEKNEEIKIVDFQLLITISILGAIFLAALVGYNSHLKLSNKKPFWNDSEARNVLIISKIIIFIAAIISLLMAIKNIEDLKQKNKNLDNAYVNASASFFFVLSALLLLIALLKNYQPESDIVAEEFVL
ncbi:MAG: hypothetical protein PHF30_00360 [Bacilli bacterium]|nr:hypothetical protein [Bacilli bacterium]